MGMVGMPRVKRRPVRCGSPCVRGYPEGGPHRVSHAESGGPKFVVMADNHQLRAEIREFLVSRRARITPEQAGLRVFGTSRRVAGLRREEVATLAGVSAEYYIRVERGNVTGVSESVLDGIAHALQLDDAERAHLTNLVRAAGSIRRAPRRPSTPGRVRPSVQRILDSMHLTPAFVVDSRLDLLAGEQARGGSLRPDLRRPGPSTEPSAVPVPRPARGRLLARLGHQRRRRGRVAPRLGGSRPLRPPPDRPGR